MESPLFQVALVVNDGESTEQEEPGGHVKAHLAVADPVWKH